MSARMNNRAALDTVNIWLAGQQRPPIIGCRSYLEFANELRELVDPALPPFEDRAEATRYIRSVARFVRRPRAT